MVNRIHKRFVSLVYMTLLGLVFLIMGNWFLLPWFIVVGILAELILWKGITPNRLTVSWTVSSLLYNGVNLLPIWFLGIPITALRLPVGWRRATSTLTFSIIQRRAG